LIDTLRQADVLTLFFSSKNIHEQLVNKTKSVLRLLMQRQSLTDKELEMVWTNCQRYESTALELTKVCIGICQFIDASYVVFFTSKIVQKPKSTVKPKEVELMMSLGRRTASGSGAIEEN